VYRQRGEERGLEMWGKTEEKKEKKEKKEREEREEIR